MQQKLAYCDLLENDTPGLLVSWYAFNGVDTGGLNFSIQHNTMKYEGAWASRWGDAEIKSKTSLYATVYSPVCIDMLRSSLHIMKNVTKRGKIESSIPELKDTSMCFTAFVYRE